MTRKRSRPLFLEKTHYQRSRAMDAARVLPVVGFLLLLMPILWTGNTGIGVMHSALFIFGLWVVMIVCAMFLSRLLRDPTPSAAPEPHATTPEDQP